MNKNATILAAFSAVSCIAFAASAEVPVKTGDVIAFLGDSITAQGNHYRVGYITLVVDELKPAGVEVKSICAGIPGNWSNHMLARFDKVVIEKKPTWMTLSCGVNDVGHVPLEAFKTNIMALVDKVDAAGIKVMILTATMISEDPAAPNNQKLAPYNDFLRQLAKERGFLLAELNAAMQEGVKQGLRFTSDGVHMAFAGNKMMASGILRAFGLPEESIAASNARWDEMPATAQLVVPLSERQRKALAEAARKAGKSIEAYVVEDRLGK